MVDDHDPGDATPRRTRIQELIAAAERLRDAHPEHHLGEVLDADAIQAFLVIVPILKDLATENVFLMPIVATALVEALGEPA